MPTDFAFRLSTYLTLGLACLCLGYGEAELLPEVSLFTGVVLVTLAASFRAGPRYEVTIPQANRIGLTIGVFAALWVGWHYVRPTSLMHTLPWPAGLLPYLGPLLLVLMPAKLLRPKHVGDWWALQAVGMVSVALAGAMADDGAFGTLLTLYAVAGVWSLGLFFFRRSAGEVPPVPGTVADPLAGVVSPPRSRGFFRQSLGWSVAAAVVALPLFFLTPRNGTRWQMGKQVEVGYAADQQVDLNRTGELQVDREVVAEIEAKYPDGRPKDDVSAVQKWRGPAFAVYDGGRWSPTGSLHLFALTTPPRSGRGRLPDLGPNQFFLEVFPTAKLVRPVVAAPVVWTGGDPAPVVTVGPGFTRSWDLKPDGSFAPLSGGDNKFGRYRQVSAPAGELDLGPAFALDRRPGAEGRAEEALATLKSTRLRRLREWSVAKVREFAGDGRLPAGVLDRADDRGTFQVAEADYEAVGAAFRNHLAASGEYTYDLNLRRQDKAIDPVEDFVFNTKTGHCERFASALALMLRSVGVPATFVLGFKGCDNDGDGKYALRQEHAHAWVEILVPRPTPAGFRTPPRPTGEPAPPPDRVWHWLALDPTPEGLGDTTADAGFGDWLGAARASWVGFFHDFIIGYNADKHRAAVEKLSAAADDFRWELAAAGLLVFGWLVGRPAWRRWERYRAAHAGPRHTGIAWYDDYLDALAAHGFFALPGRTPREFAAAVADAFRAEPSRADLADLPGTVTEAFYAVRYAGRTLPPEQVADLTAAVREFARKLRHPRRPS